MWSPPGITEPTLISRYGLMMSDLQGLITQSTSVTFQRIITPSTQPLFSFLQLQKGSQATHSCHVVLLCHLTLAKTGGEKLCSSQESYLLQGIHLNTDQS